jgi:hypothetical protein
MKSFNSLRRDARAALKLELKDNSFQFNCDDDCIGHSEASVQHGGTPQSY